MTPAQIKHHELLHRWLTSAIDHSKNRLHHYKVTKGKQIIKQSKENKNAN